LVPRKLISNKAPGEAVLVKERKQEPPSGHDLA
jgi:hypothetical protein